MKRFTFAMGLILVCFAMLASTPATATQGISAKFDQPVTLTVGGVATGCDNRGSSIEIEGSIALGNVGVKLTLKNNVKGTHTNSPDVQEGTLTLTPVDPISIPKQPVRGGVGGNPWIYARFKAGNSWTDYYKLGRCVQGANLNTLKIVLSNPTVAKAFFSGLDCSNKGTTIKIDSDEEVGKVDAEIVFTNNAKFTHSSGPYDATAGIELSGPITAPKQGNLGGAGGNPLVYGNFVLQGKNLTDPIFLGRCNKL